MILHIATSCLAYSEAFWMWCSKIQYKGLQLVTRVVLKLHYYFHSEYYTIDDGGYM